MLRDPFQSEKNNFTLCFQLLSKNMSIFLRSSFPPDQSKIRREGTISDPGTGASPKVME